MRYFTSAGVWIPILSGPPYLPPEFFLKTQLPDAYTQVHSQAASAFARESPLLFSADGGNFRYEDPRILQIFWLLYSAYLTADHEDLEKLGLKFECKRTKTGRLLVFRKTENFVKPPVMFDVDGKIDLQISECNGDGGDGVTAETHSDNNSLPAVNQIEVSAEEKSASEVSESIATADKNEYSVDVSEPPVTAESRCQNSCQPVNRNSNGGRKKKGNSKKNKKKGGKSKHGKKR